MKIFTLNVLMYILIFGMVVVVAIIESKDWNCTNAYNVFGKCHKGDGMAYRGSNPFQTDDCDSLLSKINIAAEATVKSIKWRRSFILSVLIALLAFVLVITPASLPDWTKFYLVVLIGIVVIYYNLNYYNYHKYKIPIERIKKSTSLLKKKCNC